MSEPTLQQVFGSGATQDATHLTIAKADLAAVGLSTATTNRPEALFTALIKVARVYLNPDNQETNPDIQITIEEGFPSITFRNNQNYQQNTFNLNFQKISTQNELDPDDY